MSQLHKVLIVEDSLTAMMCCEMALKNYGGIEIFKAESAEAAIEIFENNDLDLIFMDIGLPGMDGIEATAVIRKMESDSQHTPIVALTANEQASIKERCFSVGMDDYINKPFTTEKAQTYLDKHLKPKQ